MVTNAFSKTKPSDPRQRVPLNHHCFVPQLGCKATKNPLNLKSLCEEICGGIQMHG